MKKTLIGSSRIDEFIKEGEKTLYMDKSMILTSGAKDTLRDRGVAIVYGPRPVAETEDTLVSRKRLITEKDVADALAKGAKQIKAGAKAVVTPLGADFARNHNIDITRA